MTISVTRRKDHVRAALISLVEIVGDDHRIEHHFNPDDSRFAGLIETTWRELLDADFLELRGRSPVLTPSGWITGLRLSGRLISPDIRDRAQRIVRSLKARVKGRRCIHDVFVNVRELAEELNLPVGWLANAFEAQLIEKVFPKDRVKVRYERLLVRIPPTFGSDPVDIED